jgi:hypothetical protein
MVIFRDYLPSTVFSTTTSRDKIFSSAVIVRFSPMTTILPLAASACSDRINTLEFCKSMVLTEKRILIQLHLFKTQSTFINGRLDLPMENITIISSMRKRIVPPGISFPF